MTLDAFSKTNLNLKETFKTVECTVTIHDSRKLNTLTSAFSQVKSSPTEHVSRSFQYILVSRNNPSWTVCECLRDITWHNY